MTKYLFFLIIPFLLFIPAYAEVGKNFDTVQNQDGTTTWTSHYDRTLDGSQWVNYIVSNNVNELRFESAGIVYSFDKIACDFKLYDPIDKSLAIKSYKFNLAIDTIPQLLPICPVEGFTQSNDKVSFTINFGEFKTIFDMNPSGSMEWTHEIDNNEGKRSTFTISETCDDCIPISIDGNKIDFGKYVLDTKNEIHNTVKTTKADKGDYIIEYEKEINDKEKLIIDPIFGYTTGTGKRIVSTTSIAATCSTTAASNDATRRIYKEDSVSPQACTYFTEYWNVSTIPDTATIYAVDLLIDVDIATNPENCDINPMTTNPSSATNQQILDDILNGTPYLDNNNWCTTVSNNKSIDLGGAAETDVDTALVDNEFAIGIFFQTLTRNGVDHQTDFSDVRLRVIYDTPGAVTDLVAIDVRPTAVDLDWSQPDLRGQTLSGYQINSTTPWSQNVASIIVNNTANSATAYSVTGLSGTTQYSFRIGVWTINGGFNGSGNVLNITTDFDPTSTFTPGTFNLTGSGTDVRTIKYDRIDIDDTTLLLNITADNDFELACNFHYKFAAINRTYTGIANTSINANEDMASFQFNNVNNEIIDVLCWDQYTNQSARYLITITDFPLLDQIRDFRNGTFGTQGNFGALDFITVLVVVVSLVGFNRVNEFVGLVFGLFIIGGLAVLSAGTIIAWETTYTAIFAVLIMFGIAIVRRD